MVSSGFVTKITTRYQWLRVLVSNAVSVPIDNAIFAIGAFAAAVPAARFCRAAPLSI